MGQAAEVTAGSIISTAIGAYGARVCNASECAIAIAGCIATVCSTGGIAIGSSALVAGSSADSIVIGNFACSTNPNAISIGNLACSRAASGIAIGHLAETNTLATNPDHSHIAIGWCAKALGGASSIAIGNKANDGIGNGGISIGGCSCTTGTGGGATVLGYQSKTFKGGALVATGQLSCAMDNYSAAVGGIFMEAHCLCSATFGGGFGYACAQGALALGSCVTSSHTNATVIGFNLTSEKADTVHVDNLIAYGQGASKTNDIGNVTGTATVNWDNSNNQSLTLIGSTTLTFSNPLSGANYMLEITQGGAGSYTITWPTIKWQNATPPTLSTAVGKIDIISLFYDGTSYFGTFALNFA